MKNIRINFNDKNISVHIIGHKLVRINVDEIDKPILLYKVKGLLPSKKLIKHIETATKKLVLYTRDNNLYISKYADQYFRPHTWFVPLVLKRNIYFIGVMFHEGSENLGEIDNVLVGGVYHDKVKRPFRPLPILSKVAYIRINIKRSILNSEKMHQSLRIADSKGFSMPVRSLRVFLPKHNTPTIISRRLIDNLFLVAVRTTNDRSFVQISRLVYNDLYKVNNVIKNRIAFLLSKIPIKTRNINLYFEKECDRAEESGIFVFEKVVQDISIKSQNYFVLNKNSKDYVHLKNKYGRRIIKKHSFRHFYYTYLASYLISSELSFHLFNTRVYLNTLRHTIIKKPLIFLQHGIMFAKPVENPVARDFYKENIAINIYRSVISSELEATQFYKMGYTRDELIKCGLPKFDMKSNSHRTKIVFMPTYRYWEEGLVNAGRIEETSFYACIKNILELFDTGDLRKNLIITAHPKFSKYIAEKFPRYSKNLEPDVTKAIGIAKIFITDFSSASYDAHYNGAYPIYYWKERKYLEDNYKAKSALTDRNCDGPAVYTDKQLVKEVNEAIAKNYILDKKYENRYKKINEFNDNQNTERLISYLKKNHIL